MKIIDDRRRVDMMLGIERNEKRRPRATQFPGRNNSGILLSFLFYLHLLLLYYF